MAPVLTAAAMASAHESSAGYDIVLLAHVLTAVVATVAVAVAGGSALALRAALGRGNSVSDALRRYYRPGVNWPGRLLMAVPVLGGALVVMSGGQWRWGDLWVVLGLVLWASAAVLAEVVLWPAERQIQVALAKNDPIGDTAQAPHADGPSAIRTLCLRTGVVAMALVLLLVVAATVMVAKPGA